MPNKDATSVVPVGDTADGDSSRGDAPTFDRECKSETTAFRHRAWLAPRDLRNMHLDSPHPAAVAVSVLCLIAAVGCVIAGVVLFNLSDLQHTNWDSNITHARPAAITAPATNHTLPHTGGVWLVELRVYG